MYDHLIKFFRKTDGAVTVDWVVLTGALVTICLLVLADIMNGAKEEGQSLVNSALSVAQNIGERNF